MFSRTHTTRLAAICTTIILSLVVLGVGIAAACEGFEEEGGGGGEEATCRKPVVTTNAPSAVLDVSAVLNGSVNPEACLTTAWFEWGPGATSTSYPYSTPVKIVGTYFPQNEAVKITGLTPSTSYHYRIAAMNSMGTSTGVSRPLTTTSKAVHDPILFVHGWNGNEHAFDTFYNWFAADGWQTSWMRKWSYNTDQSNAVTAQEISAQVNSLLSFTHASKVDIVTHSMGALSSRYYLKNLGGTAKVEDWVSLGGPNHGTIDAAIAYCESAACNEMIPGSAFLQALNAGDETPGSVRYGTWKSNCDGVVEPPSSVVLNGAIINATTSCLIHTELHEDYPTYKEVREFIK